MTTSYSLHLTRHETGQDRESTIAQTITEEPAVMAATLRAAADRLDPPKPARPVYRSAADRRAEGDRRFLAKLAGYDGEVLPPVRSRDLPVEYLDDGPGSGTDPLARTFEDDPEIVPFARQIMAKPHGAWACQMRGQPHAGTCDDPQPLDDGAVQPVGTVGEPTPNGGNDDDRIVTGAQRCTNLPGCPAHPDAPGGWVHEVDGTTIRRLPPPRPTPAQLDAMVCPDCVGDQHTYEFGKCALPPPWNGATGTRDVRIASGPLAGMRQRRTGFGVRQRDPGRETDPVHPDNDEPGNNNDTSGENA